MSHLLVNEKTLELNITHEGMANVGIGVIYFTQQQESIMGEDVLYPCAKPFVIQFKAAKKGVDNSSGMFLVNNNKRRNQHRVLEVIANSGVCDAYYAFPLVVSDAFLTANFGSLLDSTIMTDARRLTGNLNWIDKAHTVEVQSNGHFTVRSNKVTGTGFSAVEFFEKIAKERNNQNKDKAKMYELIRDIIERMEYSVKKAEILGESEHTITLIGTDINNRQLGYFQFPVRIRGLRDKPDDKTSYQKTL